MPHYIEDEFAPLGREEDIDVDEHLEGVDGEEDDASPFPDPVAAARWFAPIVWPILPGGALSWWRTMPADFFAADAVARLSAATDATLRVRGSSLADIVRDDSFAVASRAHKLIAAASTKIDFHLDFLMSVVLLRALARDATGAAPRLVLLQMLGQVLGDHPYKHEILGSWKLFSMKLSESRSCGTAAASFRRGARMLEERLALSLYMKVRK